MRKPKDIDHSLQLLRKFAPAAARVWGATGKEIQEVFGTSVPPMRALLQRDPEFAEAMRQARAEADSRVVQALFKRAVGFRHIAFKIFQYEGKVITKRYVEHYAPDTTACIFWLTNRQRDDWKHSWELSKGPPAEVPHEGDEINTVEAARRIAFALSLAAKTISEAKEGA